MDDSNDSNGNSCTSQSHHGSCLMLDANSNLPSQQYLMSLIQLRTLSKCVELLVEYNIANNISSMDSVSVSTLAKRLSYDQGNLQRILSFIASHGILKEVDDGSKFIGTELSDLLRDDTPNNIAEMVRHFCRREMQLALIDMGSCLKNGSSSFEFSNGSPFYDFLSKQPEAEKNFDQAIANFHEPMQNKLVYSLYDFSAFKSIVEIAGGRGGLLEKILRQNPEMNGVLFERDAVIPNILPDLFRLKNRFKLVSGDAKESIGVEADLYLIANTLTNFCDEDARLILKNIALAMKKSQLNGVKLPKFLLVEPDLNMDDHPNEPSLMKRGMDMVMMYMVGGHSRSKAQWAQILRECGLDLKATIRVPPLNNAFECQLF